MVGVCASLGADAGFVDELAERLELFGSESTARVLDGDVGVASVTHTPATGGRPVRTAHGTVLAWGDVAGLDHPHGYVPRADCETESLSAYCAALYECYGLDFVRWLNGRFALAVVDDAADRVTFATDRFGTMPLHYARAGETVLVSTAVQSLTTHPDWTPGFDENALGTYFTYQTTPGTRTPFAGVERMAPGAVLTVDLDGLEVGQRSYWTPTYRPVDRPVSYFTRRLATVLSRAVDERTAHPGEYGLFQSGGGGSRLVLAAMERDPTTYHLDGRTNREARTAGRIARTADVPFERLAPDREYSLDLLAGPARLTNLVGTFHEGRAMGFAERLREDVDTLVSGHTFDLLFSGRHLPSRSCRLGPLGTLPLPFADVPDTVEEYVAENRRPVPPYFAGASDGTNLLRENLTPTRDGVRSYGVEYDSLDALVRFGSYYPHANARAFCQQALDQVLPHHDPFLDTRVVDLHLTVPTRVRLRRNLVGGTLERLDPRLAAVPDAERQVPLSASFPRQYLGTLAAAVLEDRNVLDPPASRTTDGPWPDHAEPVRSTDVVAEAIEEHADLVEAIPFLDESGVQHSFAGHHGRVRRTELDALLTFLAMPATRRVVEKRRQRPQA
ncbi:asparagine synthase-related protein [Halomarina ordinaria]|uniref:Asparagine synthase-related protein n=1 Tax=Halomarina ordinaria TaxID=3033939 RepID=A0ABD5U5V9_9EURY|nr:asparagine synthase-related protein [Halomarina sp. PSRA2]